MTASKTNGAVIRLLRWPAWLRPLHRVFLSVFGAYVVAVSSSTALALAASAVGFAPKANALIWTFLLGFIVYFAAALWTFTELRVWRLWLAFGAVTIVSVLVVHLLGGDASFGFGAA